MSNEILERHSLVEEILGERKAALGGAYDGYKNHVYRVINFCGALGDFSNEEMELIVIAASFHDIGIWTANTFDYLPPSINEAARHLDQCSQAHSIERVSFMIGEHHKLRRSKGDLLGEAFRRADLIDVTLGTFRCGLDPKYVKDVIGRFPNRGFHVFLLSTACRWFVRHPLDPLPMLKL